ncbi:MAG: ParB/RepB/Spo0J family partition protein [Oscillospiraceae bacterium]|nr:ParB/RepB/Spo0J family partition protein [Oscillospiraceae bacterium]
MSKQPKGLGRGLGALLGDYAEPAAAAQTHTLPIHNVEPNPLQPRKVFDEEELLALSESIREHGIIQPLAVRPAGNDYYQIIAGERRWRAARMAGLSEVPVLILEVDDRTVMEMALIENLQRQDLNPIEEANGYKTLMEEYGLTQEETASRVGKSRPAVTNALRLLSLPQALQDQLSEGLLSPGHARAILSLKSESLQLAAAQKVQALHLSVRQTETLCKHMEKEALEEEPEQISFTVDYIAECEKDLTRHLGRKVKIVNGKRKGRFELEFYGQEDLQTLLDLLSSLKTK